jgi:prepilin-type N-terminal cleavage/methylation domain-containing protein
MGRSMRRLVQKQQGFTLLEVLIVIVSIAILVALIFLIRG